MTKIRNENIDRWFDYFERHKSKWDEATSDIAIELGESQAFQKKILQLLNFDSDNNNHDSIYSSKSKLPKPESLDLLIHYGLWMDYDEKFLPKLFDCLKTNGTLVVFDLNYYLAEEKKFEKFRNTNLYRLHSIIFSENSFISNSIYDDVERCQVGCFIFKKSKTKRIFIKLGPATHPEISSVHLMSNLDKLYHDKKNEYWHNNWNEDENGKEKLLLEGLNSWEPSEIYKKIAWRFFSTSTEGNEYSEWYNNEYSWGIVSSSEYKLIDSMFSTHQDNLEIEKTINILIDIIKSYQSPVYTGISGLQTDGTFKSEPFTIFSTQYLGKPILDQYVNLVYPKNAIINHFQKNFTDDNGFDIALKFYEFDKRNPKKVSLYDDITPPNGTHIVFSQIGEDIEQETNTITEFTIDCLEKITGDGRIIFQLNDRKVLEDDQFEQFRNDFFAYLEMIIDFGTQEKKEMPAAFIILSKNKSDNFKLINDRLFSNFMVKRLRLQFDDKSLDISKTNVKKFEKNWKIKASLLDNIKSFISKMDEDVESVKKKESIDINVNLNDGKDEILKKIEETGNQTNKNVDEKYELTKKHVTKEHETTRSFINEIIDDVRSIKNMQIDVDEKLKQIVETVDSYKEEIGNDIEKYTKKVKEWFKNFDLSEEYSQTVIPTSEYLYERLDDLKGGTDFSSFIAYSSQALEYEVFKKIFIEFHKHIDEKFSNEEKRELTSYDTSSIKNKTIIGNIEYVSGYFHRLIKNPKLEKKYTLGFMAKTMRYLSLDKSLNHGLEYRTLKSLQELDKFIHENMKEIDKEFLDDLNEFSDLRNKAAHPGEMSQVQAKKYWKKFKDLVDSFLNKFK